MTTNTIPKCGEVWLVNFDPTIGAKIKKIRPATVLSSDTVGKLPIKLVATLTDWKDYFAHNYWHVRIMPNSTNGLTKLSAIDVLQLRGVDIQRFIRKLGRVAKLKMAEIITAVATVIEIEIF